ncbi:hypothetical protein [Mycobacterium sp.]|uniref:hypothetical protein n=1 Tax=Mycobacterium sp. TaxID=1785 RepID=UPI0031D2482B
MKVQIERAKLAELLGIRADADDGMIERAIFQLLGSQPSRSAGVKAARDEDRALVAAAVGDGRISSNRVSFWLDALARDRAGNRPVLASLASGLRPEVKAVAASSGHTYTRGWKPDPTNVTALPTGPSGHYVPTPLTDPPFDGYGQRFDSVGLPLPEVPRPVKITHGRDPSQWTEQERKDAVSWQLGQRFRVGLRPPPGGSGYHIPSPDSPSTFDETTGQWRAKGDWDKGVRGWAGR